LIPQEFETVGPTFILWVGVVYPCSLYHI